MKYLYILISICLFSLNGYAQPQLTNVGKTTPGSWNSYRIVESEGFNPGPSGANVTWDFSGIFQYPDTIYQFIIAPSQTAHSTSFPNANVVEMNSDSTFSFHRIEGDSNVLWGFFNKNDNLKVIYDKGAVMLKRPVNYLDSVYGTNARHFTVQAQTFQGEGSSWGVVDGYGTLKVPGKTYQNVLRVRVTQEGRDTTVFGFETIANTYSYSWYNADHAIPLMSWDSTFIESGSFEQIIKSTQYLIRESLTSVNEQEQNNPLELKANVSGNDLTLFSNFNSGDSYSVHLLSMEGREISINEITADTDRIKMELPELTAGMYLVKVQKKGFSQSAVVKIILK